MKKTEVKTSYIYGPVPSRRLGLSLGVDIVPAKICTLDCVYCQIGRTTEKSSVRRDFLDIVLVLGELEAKLGQGVRADYITIGGSGEPTLHKRLGDLIDGIRKFTDIPIAVLTNGTLLHRADVRADCSRADLVIPSLDAGDEAVFRAVNRPAADISIEKLVSGMAQFREEFAGQIWLEVLLIPEVSTSAEQISHLRQLIERIDPDKVQLNTAVRPPAEKGVRALSRDQLAEIAGQISPGCEVIADPPVSSCGWQVQAVAEDIVSMLKRRPCSLDDLSAGLAMARAELLEHLSRLQAQGDVVTETRRERTYFLLPDRFVDGGSDHRP
jgi:wyosine [tRNA(Phe)-imidazoG37] synthetase (radical SAM superfamily)